MKKSSITQTNLKPFEGRELTLTISVGVIMQIRGKLQIGYGFCWYALVLPDGNKIGFSWGKYGVENDKIFVSIQ